MKEYFQLKQIVLIAAFSWLISLGVTTIADQRQGSEGQGKPRTLERDIQITEELSAGEVHSYAVTLTQGQYLKVSVEQKGIDVTVIAYSPLHETLIEEDSQSARVGTESTEVVAETEGVYTIEVRSLEKEAIKGRYSIKLEELRPATEKERLLQRGNNLHRESLKTYEAGQYSKAVQLAEQALQIFEKEQGPYHLDVARILNDLGLFYKDNNDFLKSEVALQRSLGIEERLLGQNHPDTAATLNNLAELHRAKGEYAKAEPYYLRALKVAESVLGARHPHTATALNNLALLYVESGDYTKSEPLYRRSGAIYEEALGAEHPNLAQSLNNLADYYYYKGEYTKAEPLYQRALAIREKALGSVHPVLIESLASLARLYQDKGDYSNAEPLLQRSLDVSEKALGNDSLGTAYSLNNLAELYRARGGYSEAEAYYQRSLGIAERVLGPKHPNIAVPLNNLALIYEDKGDYNRAEELLYRALRIVEDALGTRHPHFAQALNNLGQLHYRKGDLARAESFFQRALFIRKEVLGPGHPDVSKSLSNLGLLFLSQGRTAQSLSHFAAAIKISEQNIALNLFAGSERQKRLYLATLANEVNNVVSLHTQLAPDNTAARRLALLTVLQRKGRTLDIMSGITGALRQHINPQTHTLLDRLTFIRAQLSTIILKGPRLNDYSEFTAKVKELNEEIDELEAKVSSLSAELRLSRKPLTIEVIQAVIPPDSALIEFVLYRPLIRNKAHSNKPYGEPQYAAYVLLHNGEPAWAELGNAEKINSAIFSLQSVLRDPRTPESEVKRISRTVDQAIMRPLRRLLGERRRLLLSPDGVLNLIPFSALTDERGRYSLESHTLTYLTSGRDLLRLRTYSPSTRKSILFANPQFDLLPASSLSGGIISIHKSPLVDISIGRFNPLNGTAEEAYAIKDLLVDAEVLSEANATETALKRVSKPKILHVATHGFFLPDLGQHLLNRTSPSTSSDLIQTQLARSDIDAMLLSGLAMAGVNELQDGDSEDGILTALEMSGLDLWGTRLAVLSACDTGLGVVQDGEGVYGLRRALVLAGAESQVMSLWRVDDEATRDFMINLYGRILSGESRGEAMRQVQLEALRTKEYKHPYFWASLIMSGHWGKLEVR